MTTHDISQHPATGAAVDTLSAGAWLVGTIDTVQQSPSQAIVLAAIGLLILGYRAYRAEKRSQDTQDAQANEATWRGRFYDKQARLVAIQAQLDQAIADYAALADRLAAIEAAHAAGRCPWAEGGKSRCADSDRPLGPQPGEPWWADGAGNGD